MVVAEVVGQQRHTAFIHTGLVDAPHIDAHARVGLGGDGQVRRTHDHGAVRPEPHGVIVGGAGEQLAAGDQDAQREAGRDVVEVAVDGADYAVAQIFIVLGGGGSGKAVAHRGTESRYRADAAAGAVGNHRGGKTIPPVQQPARNIVVQVREVRLRLVREFRGDGAAAGRIGNIVLMPRLVIGIAPENIVAEDNAVLEHGVLQPDVTAIGGGAGHRGRGQHKQQHQCQQKGYCSFHSVSFSVCSMGVMGAGSTSLLYRICPGMSIP